jgi:diguanylate cyclase (GGDEF)-like protein
MASKSLKKIIYNKFISASLIPILFIEIALLVLYFTISSYVTDETAKTLFGEVTSSTKNITTKEVEIVSRQLGEISNAALMLQNEHQEFFKNMKSYPLPNSRPEFDTHSNGIFYKKIDNGGSSLYYAANTKIGKEEREKAYYSEFMDTSFKRLVEVNPLVTQVYFNSYDNMNRLYPFMDVVNQYSPSIDMSKYNFYYEADMEHNPSKKPVWTSAYLDPAGQGWLVSCIVPIYRGDKLEGVTGIDITIDSFIKNILELKLPNDAEAFMVDDEGVILAMGEESERILGLKELKSHTYSDKINETIKKPKEFNILQHPDENIKELIGKVFLGNEDSVTLTLGGKDYYILEFLVPETKWHIFIMLDSHKLFEPIENLKKYSKQIGYYAIALMVFFYLVFFVYLLSRSKAFARKISEPIENLAAKTKEIGKSVKSYEFEASEIKEINYLNENFNEMISELSSRTNELIEMEVKKLEKEQEADRLLQKSITDSLTGLYNRLKANEVLDYEIERFKRYYHSLAIIMVDLDHFKKVNDEFGHQIGDKVLKGTAEILKKNTRKTDVVARWGGEEFIIICPDCDIKCAVSIAEKLRKCFEDYKFPTDRVQTSSFGVAEYNGESKEDFIAKADDALYEAKRKSRNTVVY